MRKLQYISLQSMCLFGVSWTQKLQHTKQAFPKSVVSRMICQSNSFVLRQACVAGFFLQLVDSYRIGDLQCQRAKRARVFVWHGCRMSHLYYPFITSCLYLHRYAITAVQINCELLFLLPIIIKRQIEAEQN